MKKKFLAIIVLILIVLAAVGCSSKSNVSFNDVSEKIKKSADVSNMRAENSEKLKKLYDIDAAKLDGFKLYRAQSNVKADEILILKVKDKGDIEDIKSKINKRIDKQATSFKDYLPKEYNVIKNNVVKTKDDFVLLAISKDADKIGTAFDEVVK